uniref:Uncharacterized protein n=1 Tax=Conchiformibius kuhniae TaxID=211502 RepID=A0A8T9MWQ5_9NEIS|nr:hypothetical protein LVJ77_00275 [Conchiformibius kuhniae]
MLVRVSTASGQSWQRQTVAPDNGLEYLMGAIRRDFNKNGARKHGGALRFCRTVRRLGFGLPLFD